MFGQEVNELTVDWAKGNSWEIKNEFNAYISLGFGQIEKPTLPLTFTCNEIAISHLGNYCTCYKKLGTIKFKG